MITFTVVLFDKFQHFYVSCSKNDFVSAHSGVTFAYPDTQNYSTLYALQNAIRGSDTDVKPRRIHCFQTDRGHHFENSLTRRSFKPIKTRTEQLS